MDLQGILAQLQQPQGVLSDPQTAALMQLGAGMMAQSGPSRMPVGLGQAIGNAAMPAINTYQQMTQDQRRERLVNMQIAMQAQKLAKDQAMQDALMKFATQTGGGTGTGGGSAMPNWDALLAAGVSPQVINAMRANWELRNPKAEIHGGVAIPPMRNLAGPQIMPQVNVSPASGAATAIVPQPDGGVRQQMVPGSLGNIGAIADVQQRATANYDLVTRPPTAPNQPPTYMSRAEALGIQGQPQAPMEQGILTNVVRAPNEAAALNLARQADAAGIPINAIAPPPNARAAGVSPEQQASMDARKSFSGELAKQQADDMIKSFKAAEDSVEIIRTLHEGRKLLDSGMVTGFGADALVSIGQVLKQAGIAYAEEPTANSQAFSAVMAQNVGKVIKLFGSGTGLSNADREYAEKMAAGKISLDENAIRKIMDINERQARWVITRHDSKARMVPDEEQRSRLMIEAPSVYVPPSRKSRPQSGGSNVIDWGSLR